MLRTAQRAGIGSALFARAMGHVRERGLHGVALWVLAANRGAKAFYEARGGAPVGERMDSEGGVMIGEVAYGWRGDRSGSGG